MTGIVEGMMAEDRDHIEDRNLGVTRTTMEMADTIIIPRTVEIHGELVVMGEASPITPTLVEVMLVGIADYPHEG